MENLTKEKRQKIALEELRKQPFETLLQPFLGHAGALMLETNADEMTVSIDPILEDGKRYKITANITKLLIT